MPTATSALAPVTGVVTPAAPVAPVLPTTTGALGQGATASNLLAFPVQAGRTSAAAAVTAEVTAGLVANSAPPTGMPGHRAPVSPVPVSPPGPAGPAGGANSASGGSGPDSGGTGGHGGRDVPGGAGDALSAHRTVMLLGLIDGTGVKPVWRSYLPEVPPA